MKKLLLFILPLLLALSAKASEFTVDGYDYLGFEIISENPNEVSVVHFSEQYWEGDGTLEIPSTVRRNNADYTVTTIGDRAFGSAEITEIILPNTITTIGEEAFCNSALTSMIVPNSVTSIGKHAFTGSAISVIELSNSITEIVPEAFYECKQLKTIEIPNSVKEIGAKTFEQCVSLTTVTIPNSVTRIAERAFCACISLASIEIPNSVTRIEFGTFTSCTSLSSVVIPNSVTIIEDCAFFMCESLTSVTIPASVTEFGKEVFRSCPSLTTVNYETAEPIEGEKVIFEDDIYERATLNVAVGGLDKAQTTSPWKYFANIKEVDFSGIEDVVADLDPEAPVEVYDLNGIKVLSGVKAIETVDNLPAGLYIVRQGNVSRKIAIK